jgi:hypothetical protein
MSQFQAWPRQPCRKPFLANEEGMLSLLSLFVVFGFLLLMVAILNTGWVVTRKIENQTAADAAAYAAGVEMARGMNAVTAANHLIGELTALVVCHHAFGGDELDGNGQRQAPDDVSSALKKSYNLARTWSSDLGYDPYGYDTVSQGPQVGAAIGDSRVRLMQVMTWAYCLHAMGGFLSQLQDIPILNIASYILGYPPLFTAIGIEFKVLGEWYLLLGMEEVARGLVLPKQALEAGILGLYGYTEAVWLATPLKAEEAARKVGNLFQVDASLFPGVTHNPSFPPLHLPMSAEPGSLSHRERSQLVRASSPWIQRWRLPIFAFADDCLVLARFKVYYQKWTNDYTLKFADKFKGQGINLYILDDLQQDGADKGQEPWTKAGGSRRADELFGVMGFAHRPPLPVYFSPVFRQTNPDGLVAYAQVLVYNANRQDRARVGGGQPVVGWDTLNWDLDYVPEFPGPQASDDLDNRPDIPEPAIRINWQVKLVPATRLKDGAWIQPGGLGAVLRRLPPQPQTLDSTH